MAAQYDRCAEEGAAAKTDRAATRVGALIDRGLDGEGVPGNAIALCAVFPDVAHASCGNGAQREQEQQGKNKEGRKPSYGLKAH